MQLLIAGATGTLGRALLEEASGRGHQVRALVRRPAQRDAVRAPGVEPVLARATKAPELYGALDGVDVVISALGITRQRDGLTYDEVDFGANANLLREAERAGVERFTYVASLEGRSMRELAMIKAKERFVDLLEASPVPGLVLRPGGFFSDFLPLLKLARWGWLPLVDGGRHHLNPVAPRDVARVALESLEGSDTKVEVGGPTVFTHREIGDLIFQSVGRSPRYLSLPGGLATALRRGLRRITPLRVHGPLEFLIATCSRDMVGPHLGSLELGPFLRRAAGGAAPDPTPVARTS
jgi:uncharacterized protein YbjT (DUF2867 family)